MKAVIVSSSDGTRLRPLTCSVPHSMLPIMGKPVIEYTVRLLSNHGIKDIVVAPCYLRSRIKKHFSISDKRDVNISFPENENLEYYLGDDDVIFISDSVLCDVDFSEFLSVHIHSGSDATIITKHTPEPYRYGCVMMEKENFVSDYTSCPDFTMPCGIPFSGIIAVKKGVKLSECKNLSLLLEKLIQNKKSIYSYTPDCYIRDISDFESYNRCCRDFMDKKLKLPFPCEETAPSVWIDENATVMQGAIITPPVYIGPGSVINKGARIEGYSQILRDVTIDCYSTIKRSIVMDNTYISENVTLRGAIAGENCHISQESAAYEGSVIGFGSKIGTRSTLRTSVHIWPDKYIEDESCISENVIWESTSSPVLFQNGSVSGIINREITPEFALHYARAAVSLLGNNLAVSCDGEGYGTMIKNALTAGIQSGGGKAYDFGDQPLPITRSGIRFYSLDGGIAFSSYRTDSSTYGSLDIINSSGATPLNEDITKLRHFITDRVSKRVSPESIREPDFVFEYKLFYLKQLINSTSKKPLGAKVLIYSPSVWATELLKSAASDLDCHFTFSSNRDEDAFLKELISGDFDLGAISDSRCETLTLVTKTGYILSEFDYCALTSLIIMKQFNGATVYIPDSAPESIEALAKKYDAQVHRTFVSPPHLMQELTSDTKKSMLHQFVYRFDAVGAIIILLDYLYTSKNTLESLLSEIPPTGTVSTTVSCPKNEQTDILGQLYLRHHIPLSKESDAVKINFENGWVLVVPDRDNSLIKIISHATNKEYAREIADICLDEIAGR